PRDWRCRIQRKTIPRPSAKGKRCWRNFIETDRDETRDLSGGQRSMRPFIPRTSLKAPTLLYVRTKVLFPRGGKTENGGSTARCQLSGHAHSTPLGPCAAHAAR